MNARVLVGVAVLGLTTTTTFADFIPMGPVVETGSWTLTLQSETSGAGLDMIVVRMESAGELWSVPAFTGASGWTEVYNNASTGIAVYVGGPTANVTFTLHGEGFPSSSPVTFNIIGFQNGSLVEGNLVTINPSFHPSGNTWSPSSSEILNLIPLPPAMWMGAIGLAGIFIGRKRLRRG